MPRLTTGEREGEVGGYHVTVWLEQSTDGVIDSTNVCIGVILSDCTIHNISVF